jgi:hypothetical protein
MKKVFLSILAILFTLKLVAQCPHLKFMGIPLDGKISAFNKEMQKKGFTLDKQLSKAMEGVHIYNGNFAGERGQVFISFDDKTKIVYLAGVLIKHYTKQSAIKGYEDMRDMLEEKYSQDDDVRYFENMKNERGEQLKEQGITPFEWKQTSEEEGYEATTFIIPNLESRSIIGDIKVFLSESYSNVSYTTEYNLYIRYTDWQNDKSQRENRMDDL